MAEAEQTVDRASARFGRGSVLPASCSAPAATTDGFGGAPRTTPPPLTPPAALETRRSGRRQIRHRPTREVLDRRPAEGSGERRCAVGEDEPSGTLPGTDPARHPVG